MTGKKSSAATVLSLAQLLEQQPSTPRSCLVEPGLLPPQGILFVGGEPKVGKSLLVANLALSLASARLAAASPSQRRAVCSSVSSNFLSRSSSIAWLPCGKL